MRFREFLIEYSRAKTAEMFGNKLLQSLVADSNVPNQLVLAQLNLSSQPFTAERWAAENPEKIKMWIDTILSVIESHDPTPNNAYTPWLARMYAKGGLKIEDLNRNQLLSLYDIAKNRRMLKPEHKDINSFKTYKQFEDAMVTYDLEAIENTLDKEEEKGQAKKVYEDENVTVIVPEDEAAACRYGRGTRWCTAATRGQNFFDSYNRQGRMYILLPKNPIRAGEKYQLHFQSQQYMNEDDDQVDLVQLLSNRFPNLLEFFLAMPESGLKADLRFTDPADIQDVLDKIREVGNDWISEKVADVENDDYDYYKEMADQYPDEDGMVDWDAVHKAGDDYLQYNDYLKGQVDELTNVLDVSADDIKEYVNDADSRNDLFEIRHIPHIIEEIFWGLGRYGSRNNTMFTEFFKNLDVVRNGDDWQARL